MALANRASSLVARASMSAPRLVLAVLTSPFKSRLRLEAENAAFRLTNHDRWFLIQLYRWFLFRACDGKVGYPRGYTLGPHQTLLACRKALFDGTFSKPC